MIARMMMAAVCVAAGSAASAQGVDSVYTRIDENCSQRELTDQPGVETSCRGHGDWIVHIAAGEHGSAIAYGRNDVPDSGYILPPMRGLYGGFNDVIEWRLEAGAAFATIHRYLHYNPPEMLEVSGGLEEPHTLIVTALAPADNAPACAVAFVDASALANANLVARDIADRMARNAHCPDEPVMFDAANPDVDSYLARGPR